MNDINWYKWLRGALCCATLLSMLPVLLSTIAPAIAIASVVRDPNPGNILSTSAPWWLVALLLSHLWFVIGAGALAAALPAYRPASNAMWRAAIGGLLALCLFLILDAGTSTTEASKVTGYAWPALALSAAVLWLARRAPRAGDAVAS